MAFRPGAVLLACVLLSACGGSSNPAAPTPQIPNVVGNYSGNTNLVFPEIPQTLSCPTTTSVTQSGGTVNIAPLQWGGVCGGVSVPLGQFSIDNTGNLLGQSQSTYRDTCGVYNVTASGGFFGRELRMSISATSTTCYNMNITINLSR
jgi:hypothetical protein